jgi:hypothetical protein
MQITIEPGQRIAIQRKADAAGVSIAEYVRRLIAADIEPEPRRRGDISAVFNLGNSGGSDISRYKDEYLGEAVEVADAERRRA